ncbi:hypothetical protein CDD81_5854 [Ophiocordyceps australis]|uniref:Uncharacterized protein n=1 Tax=Ophiocordyceps australis TaxID=1399860 RepID=A0A2C5YHF0_9HYPO|nr:hypothetical protein CDD81_5854 [Ophiocordyceps australis]
MARLWRGPWTLPQAGVQGCGWQLCTLACNITSPTTWYCRRLHAYREWRGLQGLGDKYTFVHARASGRAALGRVSTGIPCYLFYLGLGRLSLLALFLLALFLLALAALTATTQLSSAVLRPQSRLAAPAESPHRPVCTLAILSFDVDKRPRLVCATSSVGSAFSARPDT